MNAVVETKPALPATMDTVGLMSRVLAAAQDPALDVGKMERLFELWQKMDGQRREDAFNEAMKACQAEMPHIHRDKKNEHKNYKYSTLEEVNAKAVPIYTKHGFALSFGTVDCPLPGHYRMTCKVSHQDGVSRDYMADLPVDDKGDKGNANKTAIQGFGSSMSYGRRYLTMMIFNISTTDDNDGEGYQPPGAGTITDEQHATLQRLMGEAKADESKFLGFFKVAELSALPAVKFGQAENMLQTKIAQNKVAPK